MPNLKVEVYGSINDINKNQWNNLVEQSGLGSFFQRYEWLKAIEVGIGSEARHIAVLQDDNLIGVFPNFVTDIKKTPFKQLTSTTPGFGGLIIATQEREVLDLMLKTVSEICGGNIISHYISTLDFGYSRYGQYLEKKGYQPDLGDCRFIIDLSKNCENIKSNMKSGRRRNLNKALKKNFVITDEKINIKILSEFYKSYEKVIKKVRGNAYPFSFFTSLNNTAPDRIKIFSAFVEGKQSGKILCFLDKEQSSMHYFFSGIEEANFKYYASELLHWHAIKWGIENDYKKYDFGSTGADFDDGLFKFKEEFGGHIVPTLSWEKGYSKVKWKLFEIAKTFYRIYKKIR